MTNLFFTAAISAQWRWTYKRTVATDLSIAGYELRANLDKTMVCCSSTITVDTQLQQLKG